MRGAPESVFVNRRGDRAGFRDIPNALPGPWLTAAIVFSRGGRVILGLRGP